MVSFTWCTVGFAVDEGFRIAGELSEERITNCFCRSSAVAIVEHKTITVSTVTQQLP